MNEDIIGKALRNRARRLAVEYFLKALRVQVAKPDNAVGVKTAGQHPSVAEHRDMVLHSVTEAVGVSLGFSAQVGPIEAFSVLKINAVSDFLTLAVFAPPVGKISLESVKYSPVIRVSGRRKRAAVKIPQSQNRDPNPDVQPLRPR